MRLISLGRSGRNAVIRGRDGLIVVDALGPAPRITLAGGAADFTCVGTDVWVLRKDGLRLDRFALATGRPLGSIALEQPGAGLCSDRAESVIVVRSHAASSVLVHGSDVVALSPELETVFPLGGRRVAAVEGARLRVVDVGRRRETIVGETQLPGAPISVHALFGGRLLAVLVRNGEHDEWTVLDATGARVHRIAAPCAMRWTVASDAGVALAVAEDGVAWSWLDLRYGTERARGDAPWPLDDLELSADGRYVLFAAVAEGEPRVLHVATVDLLARAEPTPVTDDALPEPQVAAGSEPHIVIPPEDDLACGCGHHAVACADPDDRDAALSELASVIPHALGAPLPPIPAEAEADWAVYGSMREHLDAVIELAAARVALAIARGRDAGRFGEHEVLALVGDHRASGHAGDELRDAEARVTIASTVLAGRVRASLAAGIRLPLIELMRELDLSPTAGHIAMIALAAAERAEVGSLLAILANDERRPGLDRGLLELVLADRERPGAIAAALAPSAPLRRHGILCHAGETATAPIAIDPVVIERCSGRTPAPRPARAIDELWIAPEAVRELAAAVASVSSEPLRLILRGRRGSGRRSALAALAARVGRRVADLDGSRLRGAEAAESLARELRRATLRGCIPVVSGLELADPADAPAIRHVVRAHGGPIVFRTDADAHLPIDPGARVVTFPALTEGERAAYWRRALARTEIAVDADALAARWRLAPGQIEDVVSRAVAAGPATRIDEVARTHVATRLSHLATPVRRLAAWEHVALPEEMIDSVRELIGRAAQRKTVFDEWGFDGTIASSRGLTALFYGPPGTGKSMVAGLVARELGLELYRIDLSRVVSKWLGETEKHLAEVFDAAEDGQVVLLFDEADSLFARRTEVRTSNDRYANLEVNYLLQRLDSFEGIAILTTNLDGSIDPAFKRRMSMRLHFPFPDEDMRRRLWETHIPAATPTARDFDFAELARRFPLSGGYIRNSVLRAAFIAAHEHRPLAHDHLLRAVALEYRELGKLATDGKLE